MLDVERDDPRRRGVGLAEEERRLEERVEIELGAAVDLRHHHLEQSRAAGGVDHGVGRAAVDLGPAGVLDGHRRHATRRRDHGVVFGPGHGTGGSVMLMRAVNTSSGIVISFS